MAKDTNDLEKYLAYARKMKTDALTDDEMKFFLKFKAQASDKLPEINKQIKDLKARQAKLTKAGEPADEELTQQIQDLTAESVIEAGRDQMQSKPYREQLRLSRDEQGKKTTGKLAQGINLGLAGWDISQSGKQIKAAERAAAKSKRPTAPGMGRDAYLQRALRNAELGTFDSEKAIAPAKAQIADQYKADMANAAIASGGQSGAYGAYGQLAADRRKRAGLELAPAADAIRAREQARYDNLLAARATEGQQIQANNLNLYGKDLDQYNQDQQAAAALGAQGRLNQRNAYANLGEFGSQAIGQNLAENRYRKAYNQLLQYGSEDAAKIGVAAMAQNDNIMGYNPQAAPAAPAVGGERPYGSRFGYVPDEVNPYVRPSDPEEGDYAQYKYPR